MSRFRALVLGMLIAAVGLSLGAYWLTSGSENDLQASISVADAMNSDTAGYRRATEVRDFSFPEDHGPHPGFKNEWWYVTGTLDGPEGRAFGYELTIFRFALAPPGTRSRKDEESDWRTDQFFMAHFAVTDSAEQTFHAYERFGRGGAGLAGAQTTPLHVWLEDWSMQSVGSAPFPLRLRAQEEETAIDLTLRPEKPMVLQGERGLSRKGPGSGNASYYYSYTRLGTDGLIATNGDTTQVTGLSWMDREWSTSALGPNQVGWDWFSFQLDDGRDLMYYQIRNEDGSPSRFSEGTIVGTEGETQKISREDVELEVLDTWTTPDGTHTYPVEWRLCVPSEELTLHVVPYLPNQEMDVSVRYWEGAVRVNGASASPSGRGYVEMTGYGNSPSL